MVRTLCRLKRPSPVTATTKDAKTPTSLARIERDCMRITTASAFSVTGEWPKPDNRAIRLRNRKVSPRVESVAAQRGARGRLGNRRKSPGLRISHQKDPGGD